MDFHCATSWPSIVWHIHSNSSVVTYFFIRLLVEGRWRYMSSQFAIFLTHVCSTSSSYIMYDVAFTECHVNNNVGTYLVDCWTCCKAAIMRTTNKQPTTISPNEVFFSWSRLADQTSLADCWTLCIKNKQQTTTIIPAVGNLTRWNNKQQQSTPSWGHGFPLFNQSSESVDEWCFAPHHLHTLCMTLRNVSWLTTLAMSGWLLNML